eukprot:TRINITY_DN26760_c0_g1_i1.p1 TRINITY_DN26760_c0_g1~~TRINITY_DN26760_c0_g1_i1.p1  ORF type:complete len:161 (-),score=44.44 TRINITY_DN26760_c0_g1_i1:46-528(-)
MIRRPPRSTLSSSSAASDVYKRQPQTHNLLLANKYANDINTKPTHPTTKQPTPQHQHDEHESESAALRDLAEALRGEVDGLTGAYIDQERIQRAILITNEMREYDILSQLRRCVVRGLHWPTTVHSDERRELSLIHISEPTRLLSISYAVFCLKKKKKMK